MGAWKRIQPPPLSPSGSHRQLHQEAAAPGEEARQQQVLWPELWPVGSRREQGNGVRTGRQRRGALGCPAAPFPVLLHCLGGRGGGGVGKGGVRLSLGRAGLGEAVLVWVCCCSPAPFLIGNRLVFWSTRQGGLVAVPGLQATQQRSFPRLLSPWKCRVRLPLLSLWVVSGVGQAQSSFRTRNGTIPGFFFLFRGRNVKRREK